MSTPPGPPPRAGGSTEILLQATITQPMVPFRTEETIDPDATPDDRSAIDQFVATIEALNVVLSRHSPQGSRDEDAPGDPVGENKDDTLDSLLALDGSEIEIDPDPPANETGTGISDEFVDTDHANAPPAIPPAGEDEVTVQLNNLVFLGYMSAVESYFRCLTRQLIWADDFTAEKVHDLKVSFGAARHADPKLLPEVLMEDMTFITLDSVKGLLNTVLGVGIGGVSDVIAEYDKICQLRHCIVHRFGRLGSKNAAKLGLATHKTLFERRIKISSSQLEELAFSLLNFVRALNNHIYANVMERSAAGSTEWQWDAELDSEFFNRLYSVFRKTTSPGASVASNDAYEAFKAKCEKGSATQVQRAKQNRERRSNSNSGLGG